jgi:hypothetical protein
MDKRHFTVVIGSKEHGLFISSKPSSAAKKAVSKLCASNKSKKVEFSLREITQGSKKKTYGPYVGEMKKLKKPIELKGRIIRHEIKLHLKNWKSLKTTKKMRGGENRRFELTQNMKNFYKFLNTTFTRNHPIKYRIFQRIKKYLREFKHNNNVHNIFYIYNNTNLEIISIGVISIKSDGTTLINGKEYLYLEFLLSKEQGNRGGTSAIYHILSRLSAKYSGICLNSIETAFPYYMSLGFMIKSEDLLILDKTEENIRKLEAKLPHPITTEFHSTYLNNIIT